MNCWHCGFNLTWGGDHDLEEEDEERARQAVAEQPRHAEDSAEVAAAQRHNGTIGGRRADGRQRNKARCCAVQRGQSKWRGAGQSARRLGGRGRPRAQGRRVAAGGGAVGSAAGPQRT